MAHNQRPPFLPALTLFSDSYPLADARAGNEQNGQNSGEPGRDDPPGHPCGRSSRLSLPVRTMRPAYAGRRIVPISVIDGILILNTVRNFQKPDSIPKIQMSNYKYNNLSNGIDICIIIDTFVTAS